MSRISSLYTAAYTSPLGELLLAADAAGLVGLWLPEQHPQRIASLPGTTPALEQTRDWLDGYFSGRIPEYRPPLHLMGTDFQLSVWKLLLTIPYGKTMTYGEIARLLSPRMSAQAVGGALGRNPISIIVPCHRVLGARGQLTGYAGGLVQKEALLKLEHIL